MKKNISIIIFISLIQTANYVIAPILYSHSESGGKVWNVDDKTISVSGWGIALRGNINNLNIELDAYNSRFIGLSDRPNYFNHDQGIAWVGNDPQGEQFDFDVTNTKLSYTYKSVTFEFGKFNRHWGPGIASLILSDKVPSFPQFGFTYNATSNFKFEYFHGSLRSLEINEFYSQYYNNNGIGEENPELNRFIAGHRLEWSPNKKITIGASELVVYGVREMDLIYLLPIAPFLSLQQYAGDLDNIQWELDLNWSFSEDLNLFFSFLMDEWKPSMTFDKPNRNWFAYQLGLLGDKILFDNDSLAIELNWTDHRVYRHQNPINDYYSHGYPLGFWGGPHAEEIVLEYSFIKFDLLFSLGYSYSKRGELTSSMLENQYDDVIYDRFSNVSELISVFDLIISKEIKNGFKLHFGISYIDWANGNFDPFNSSVSLKNIEKNSIMFGFSQNFDIFNQRANITKNSMKKSISM